jgi:hypothetical protein
VTDCCGALVTAWLAASEVVAAVWVLAAALVVVPEVVAARVAAVVGSDVAAEQRASGLERGGCGVCRGGVDRPGGVCHRFRGVWGWFEAGKEVVAVVDVVGVIDVADGGCAGVVSGDGNGLARVSSRGAVCITASAVEADVV